jgi:NADH dehydrogenase
MLVRKKVGGALMHHLILADLGFPLWLRLSHYINLLFIGLVIRSGIQILGAHPRLYWSNGCTPRNAPVILAEVTGVDTQGQRVLMHERSVSYDYLGVATGARQSYFSHEAWEPFAPGLKSLADPTQIRRKTLLAFEAAEIETNPEQR